MHSVSVTALTVADRGPGSMRLISPNTLPAPSVPTLLALAASPMLTSTEPAFMRKAVLPASPSERIVSPALNLMVCIAIISWLADVPDQARPIHLLLGSGFAAQNE